MPTLNRLGRYLKKNYFIYILISYFWFVTGLGYLDIMQLACRGHSSKSFRNGTEKVIGRAIEMFPKLLFKDFQMRRGKVARCAIEMFKNGFQKFLKELSKCFQKGIGKVVGRALEMFPKRQWKSSKKYRENAS